ncbi:hypothetical protein [Planktosalinus lacus]|uniref:Uncharacterized protein n=1 Tax=Planktosalinus lacus TaxID=1526573 RepID=A0A8J2Y532_9FLAO|nr:hypothetical protein [Planktosalinus lacus]GGD82664.1 hypothetical protein GCM10011312_03540 [Planktosalinus lacus]
MALHKILRIVVLILSLIGIALLATILTGSENYISLYMNIAYAVLAIAVLFTVLFSFTQLFTHKDALKKTLISVVLFVLVIVISYFLSEGVEVTKDGVQIVSERGSKWVGTGLRTFYFLAIIAIGLMIFSGIQKLIKN